MTVNALDYIIAKYQLKLDGVASPIQIKACRVPDLVNLYAELGFTRGVEIGVDRGLFAEAMCKANPKLHLWGVDPWLNYPRYGEVYTDNYADECHREAVTRLSAYNVTLIRAYSLDALSQFDDGSLDYCYIDGNHAFEFVVNDIAEWSRKVRPGGIVSGHDYCRPKNRNRWDSQGVIHAVNGYTWAYRIHPWFILRGKGCSGWLWIKGAH